MTPSAARRCSFASRTVGSWSIGSRRQACTDAGVLGEIATTVQRQQQPSAELEHGYRADPDRQSEASHWCAAAPRPQLKLQSTAEPHVSDPRSPLRGIEPAHGHQTLPGQRHAHHKTGSVQSGLPLRSRAPGASPRRLQGAGKDEDR
jgi:hypothetical protein